MTSTDEASAPTTPEQEGRSQPPPSPEAAPRDGDESDDAPLVAPAPAAEDAGAGDAPAPAAEDAGAENGAAPAAGADAAAGATEPDASAASAAPAPGPRDPMDIPEQELQEVAQAILAGTVDDLTSLTLGQLRATMEQRLGLEAGALGARKALRRRVARVVEEQVGRRKMRGPECEHVVRCLVGIEDYPREVRQMLIDSLPNAVKRPECRGVRGADGSAMDTSDSGARALHPHQVRLLEIMREALEDARAREAEAEAAHLAEVEATKEALGEHRATCTEATTREVAAKALMESRQARIADLNAETKTLQAELNKANKLRASAGSESTATQERLKVAVELRDGPLKAVLNGTWTSDADRSTAIAASLKFFSEDGGDPALLAALPAALKRRPGARTAFDALTVQSLADFFQRRVAEMEAALATGFQESAEARISAAEAAVEAARERARQQQELVAEAKASAEEAGAARRAAEAQLAHQWSQMRDVFGKMDRAKRSIQDFVAAIELLSGWIAGGPLPFDKPPPAPPAPEGEQGPAAAAADGATEAIVAEGVSAETGADGAKAEAGEGERPSEEAPTEGQAPSAGEQEAPADGQRDEEMAPAPDGECEEESRLSAERGGGGDTAALEGPPLGLPLAAKKAGDAAALAAPPAVTPLPLSYEAGDSESIADGATVYPMKEVDTTSEGRSDQSTAETVSPPIKRRKLVSLVKVLPAAEADTPNKSPAPRARRASGARLSPRGVPTPQR